MSGGSVHAGLFVGPSVQGWEVVACPGSWEGAPAW